MDDGVSSGSIMAVHDLHSLYNEIDRLVYWRQTQTIHHSRLNKETTSYLAVSYFYGKFPKSGVLGCEPQPFPELLR